MLKYFGKLAILVAIIGWFVEAPALKRADIRENWSILFERGGGRMEALLFLHQ
ncbi:hypothetical protein [uncultured Pontibacter sp.]|uniref:hypothetical protein n=1 Tax=uncultured Pontibacter sp. TaxID=453356 RepID=UPI00261A1815|nr:hypothetical protein [uncultured Pontibacter sp.]